MDYCPHCIYGRKLFSNLEKVTWKINANNCCITGVYLRFFLPLQLMILTIGLNKRGLCVSNSPHFWTPIFEKKLELCVLGEHKHIFKVWMLLSGIDLHLGWQISQMRERALATWSFLEEYVLKVLPWPSSNLEASTFLTFPQPKRTKFSCAESVFSVD